MTVYDMIRAFSNGQERLYRVIQARCNVAGVAGVVVFLMQDVQFSYSQMILSTMANC